LYSSQNIIRVIKSSRIRWAEHTACMDKVINAYKISVEKSKAKRLLRKPICRWDDNIKMGLK
jgi:hypothetical protein